MTERPPDSWRDDFEQDPTTIVDLQADSDIEDRLLSGLGKPIRTGWALWGRSLRTVLGGVLPVVALAALVSMAVIPYLEKAERGTRFNTQQGADAAEEAPVGPEYPFKALPPWPLLAILGLLLIYGLALTGVILSAAHTGRQIEQPYLWTAKRFLPWVGANALTFGVPIGLFLLAGILMGLLNAAGPMGPFIGCAGIGVAMLLIIVVSLRLFWADELALIHQANPIEAVKESWELTRNGARQIFSFQFVVGLLAYPVFMISFLIFGVVGIPLRVLGALAPEWLAAFLWMMIAYTLVFLGYGILHAPEVVYFYGIRAARRLLDPEELATQNWISAAKQKAIQPR